MIFVYSFKRLRFFCLSCSLLSPMPRIAPKFNRCFKNTYLLEELKVDVLIKEIVH